MSGDFELDDVEPEFEIVSGRASLDWTQAEDWVALSGISPAAHSLWLKLKMHVNHKRGNAIVYPSAESIALMMGLSRGDKFAKQMRELEKIGAVGVHPSKVRTRYGGRRNCYVVHSTPPEGYTRPTTIKEWYAANRDVIDTRLTNAQNVRNRQRAAKRLRDQAQGHVDAQMAGQLALLGDLPDVSPPKQGDTVTPPNGGDVTPPKQGENLKEVEPEEVPSSPHPPRASAPTAQEEEDDLRNTTADPAEPVLDEALRATALEVLSRTETEGQCQDRHRVTGRSRKATLVTLTAQHLQAGWTVDALVEELLRPGLLNQPLGRDVYPLLKYRLEDVCKPPAPAPTKPTRTPDAECPCGGTAWLSLAGFDDPTPCPEHGSSPFTARAERLVADGWPLVTTAEELAHAWQERAEQARSARR